MKAPTLLPKFLMIASYIYIYICIYIYILKEGRFFRVKELLEASRAVQPGGPGDVSGQPDSQKWYLQALRLLAGTLRPRA